MKKNLRRKLDKLTKFVNSGYLLIFAAVLGLVLANLPTYNIFDEFSKYQIHLPFYMNLSVENLVEEGLLTIFFLNVGLDLKHEFLFGPFNDKKKALLPIISAAGGVIVPALFFLSIVFFAGQFQVLASGWAIPSVTDIALSLAVLSFILLKKFNDSDKLFVKSSKTFLMTLAVADDIFGILIIALFYSRSVNFIYLFFALIFVCVWRLFSQFDSSFKWLILVPLGLAAWYFTFKSGVHTAIIGAILGFTIAAAPKKNNWKSRIVKYRDFTSVISGLFVLPIYIFFKMKINFIEIFNTVLYSETSYSVIIVIAAIAMALAIGKPAGIMLFTYISDRWTPFTLESSLNLKNIWSISCLAGIGFTVSFLIADLSFISPIIILSARLGVIIGSLLSVFLAYLFCVKNIE
ncbi:MAG: Na+/H+ antiporter NhaA [Bifidobacteriaceae bacterium]|jgi:NhaA family Na+:H+ antiporter|nr:Na+/H+ antiporter NhaA [Bifidobacteriaceae bacterium]